MEQAFLRAILDDPDNDLPRLIYADWLEERGDPRAEFIRVQCELARWPLSEARYAELIARSRALRQAHQFEWLADRGVFPLERIHFRRGFPHRITVDAKLSEQMASHLLERFPTILSVHQALSAADVRPGPLPASVLRRFARFGGGNLSEILGNPDLQEHLQARVTAWEDMSFYRNMQVGLTFQSLRHLGIRDFNPDWLRLAQWFPRLESLSLLRVRFAQYAPRRENLFPQFLEAAFSLQLVWLSLRQCEVRGEEVRRLLQAGSWPRLQALNLSQNKLTDADADRLLQTDAFPNLEILVLWDHLISPGRCDELRKKYGPGVRFDRRIPDEWDRWR